MKTIVLSRFVFTFVLSVRLSTPAATGTLYFQTFEIMDFSVLTDDQLIELLRAALVETMNRGKGVADAAREVMLSEKEREEIRIKARERAVGKEKREEAARIIAEEEEKVRDEQNRARIKEEQEKIKRNWEMKKSYAQKLSELIPGAGDIWVNVWIGGGEKRVYVQNGEPFGRKTKDIAILYLTGNSRKTPGSLDGSFGYWDVKDTDGLRNTLVEIGARWNSLKFSANEALQYNG